MSENEKSLKTMFFLKICYWTKLPTLHGSSDAVETQIEMPKRDFYLNLVNAP